MSDDGQQETEPLAFEGHWPRSCGEHRTVGPHRAWCHDDGEWCYPESPCPGCQQPVGVCVICASNVYHDGGHFPEAAVHNHAGYNCVAPRPQVVGNYIGDPYCAVCPPRSNAASVSAQAATPPLVAAPPVPPVVPDSEPQMDALPVCAICKGRLDDGHHPYCAIVLDGLSSHVAVPAVTDDEAAVKVVRATVEEMWQESPREIANVVVADLRSAGFLIVHHTKEN